MTGALAAEVLVVGAGPAGAAVGLLLARAGHDVLIVDRHQFPRPKPCGDCLSAATAPLLSRLGISDEVRRLPHAELLGWRIFAPDGTAFSVAFRDLAGTGNGAHWRGAMPDHALAVERASLDAALLRAAVAAGARFVAGAHVRDLLRANDGTVCGIATAGGPLRARLTIGADGLRSVVARRLGAVARPARLRKLSLTVHLDAPPAPGKPAMGEMHTGDGICAGFAPLRVDGTRSNLTVVADARRFGRAVAADPRAFIRRVVGELPGLAGRIPDGAWDNLDVLASGPFDRPVHTVVFDGAALVGDAAGYFDPFTGQGVHHALLGAGLLADTASAALRAGDCSARRLSPYAAALARTLRGPRFVQHGIESVLARPRLASFAIRRIRATPQFARRIVAVTGDLAPATSLCAPHVLFGLFRSARPGVPA